MPVKTKHRKAHHVAHKKEKRSKHFLKVYAPYIPLLLIVASGIFLSNHSEIKSFNGRVMGYAVNTSDDGLLDATNQQRMAQGLKPLKYTVKLDAAAQEKANDMNARNYWSHNTPDGQQPWIFIDKVDYKYKKAAENLAYGFATSTTTVNGWMSSPGHRANILDPELEEVGFGIVNVENYQNSGPETIVVAMYAQPVEPSEKSDPLPVISTSSPANPGSVNYLQSLTAGKAPWATFIIGLVIGSIAMYLTVKHARGLRRALRTSENFVIHHPVLDVTLVALLALLAMVSINVGNIY